MSEAPEDLETKSWKHYVPTKHEISVVLQRVFTRGRMEFALGLVVLGWAFSLLLEGTYSVWLGATIFVSSILIEEIRAIPASRSKADVFRVGEIEIVQNILYAVGLFVPAILFALIADIRIMFSVLILVPILGLYLGRVLPDSFLYQRMKNVPIVNDALLAFGTGVFLLSSVLFFNQVQSGAGVVLLIILVTLRFFIGFSLDDIGTENARGNLFADARPPANLPERFGSSSTKHALLVLNAATFILFGSLLAFRYLHPMAAFPLLSYLFSFVFIIFVNPKNKDSMTRYYWVLDTYIFFFFTVIGWFTFNYGAV